MAVENRSIPSISHSMRVLAELTDRAHSYGSDIEPSVSVHPGGVCAITVLADKRIQISDVYAWHRALNGVPWELTYITVDTEYGRRQHRHTTVQYDGVTVMVQFVEPAKAVAA